MKLLQRQLLERSIPFIIKAPLPATSTDESGKDGLHQRILVAKNFLCRTECVDIHTFIGEGIFCF